MRRGRPLCVEPRIELAIGRVDLTTTIFHTDPDRHAAVGWQGLLVNRVEMVGASVITADAVKGIKRFQAVDTDDAVINQGDLCRPAALKRFA
jgi:hypothetical protein